MDRVEAEAAPFRIERDSMGEVKVPAAARWGAQTQRALQNFPASGLTMPAPLLRALGLVKYAAARANAQLGDLPQGLAEAIAAAALEIADGASQSTCSRPAPARPPT
jgi:fumarate hydratase class II